MTASAIAHLSLLALLFVFSDVRPFGAIATESMPVEIVAPQEIPEKASAEIKPEPVPTPTPQLDFSLPDKPVPLPTPAPAPQQAPAARPQKQAAAAASQPPPQPAAQAQPQAQPQGITAAGSAWRQPEPDLTLKYNVLLGLPPDMQPGATRAVSPAGGDKGSDNFDAAATEKAEIGSSVVTAFRRHLRSCSKLVAGLSPADDVKVKLRVFMGRDGKLAAEPVLIEASASMKGPLLMQSAVKALEACQPYAMLPVERYGEWKVLDLSFTTQDF